jgi:hypothetical protein
VKRAERSTIEVMDAAWIGRGDFLQIGEGDSAELVCVRAVHESSVEVVRVRRRHKATRWLRRLYATCWVSLCVAGIHVHRLLCGLRSHQLSRTGPIDGSREWYRHCWCGYSRDEVHELLDSGDED